MQNEKSKIIAEIGKLVQNYFSIHKKREFIPGKTKIPLNVPSYGWEEVYEAIDSMLSTFVTMGEKVRKFEETFADYVGVKHAIMVNSGSSANLIALSILTNPVVDSPIKPGDEIITPAVTWATTVFPIINCNATPVLVDVDVETLNIIPEEVEKAITDRTKAIMPVHLLGNPCEMEKLVKIAREYDLKLIEDCCEAHGAEYGGKKVGTFGDLATFSFFFAHHISTIEGGMVLTNNDEYAELAKAMRVFGWIRDMKNKEKIAMEYPEIDPRFLFYNIGYNLRPTEIQGAFGIHQMKKLEKYIAIRRENAKFWTEKLEEYSDYFIPHRERENTRHVWYGYPITVRQDAPFSKRELVDFLERKMVETRPVMAGNIDEQPAMRLYSYKKTDLPNSRFIMRNSLFIGNHHGIGVKEREAVIGYIDEFVSDFR